MLADLVAKIEDIPLDETDYGRLQEGLKRCPEGDLEVLKAAAEERLSALREMLSAPLPRDARVRLLRAQDQCRRVMGW